MNLLQYSNGWGHLVMSVVSVAAGLLLILLSSDPTAHNTGYALLTVTITYWFASSGINTAVHQIQQAIPQPPPTDPPAATEVKA